MSRQTDDDLGRASRERRVQSAVGGRVACDEGNVRQVGFGQTGVGSRSEAGHIVAVGDETAHRVSADETGRADDENAHDSRPRRRARSGRGGAR